ncbi:MAG: hypothetical protein ACPGR0_07775, partial [Candidatus Poseidoniaceae archaeon]
AEGNLLTTTFQGEAMLLTWLIDDLGMTPTKIKTPAAWMSSHATLQGRSQRSHFGIRRMPLRWT